MNTKKTQIIQVVVGTSLNGRITDGGGDFKKYSSPEDQDFLRKKIKESDVLIMGRKTFEKHVKKSGSKPIIVFSRQDIGPFCHSERVAPGGEPRNPLHFFSGTKNDFLTLLNQFDYHSVTVLGGAKIYHWFIQQGLATDLYVTVEPYIFGSGKNFLRGDLLKPMPIFQLVSAKHLNDQGTVLLHYQP